MWTPYDWLNKFYNSHIRAVVSIISRHCTNQPIKIKLLLYKDCYGSQFLVHSQDLCLLVHPIHLYKRDNRVNTEWMLHHTYAHLETNQCTFCNMISCALLHVCMYPRPAATQKVWLIYVCKCMCILVLRFSHYVLLKLVSHARRFCVGILKNVWSTLPGFCWHTPRRLCHKYYSYLVPCLVLYAVKL